MTAAITVYLKELRESLRDRRVLLNALLIGPLLGPILFTMILRLSLATELEKADKPVPVVVIGAERAPNLIEALKQQGLVPEPPVKDIERAVQAQSVNLALRISEGYATDWEAGRPAQVDRLREMLRSDERRTSVMRLVVRGLSPQVGTPLVIADRDQATPQARGALLFAML